MSDSPDSANNIQKRHDSLFKWAMNDLTIAAALLNDWLPEEIKSVCDLRTLRSEATEFTNRQGKTRTCDMLYSLLTQGGGRGWIMVEHQSVDDKRILERMEEYRLCIRDRHSKPGKPQPLIIPILLYHGARPYSGARDIYSLREHAEISRNLDLHYPVIDLTAMSYDKLMAHGRGAMLELALKCGRVETEAEISTFLKMAASLKDSCSAELYTMCMKYWLNMHGIIVRNYPNCLDALPKQAQEEIMLISGGLIQEGERIGIQKGEQIGIQKGEQIGIQKGEQIGIQKGEQIGIQKGEQIGIQKGEQIGIQKGEQAGILKGKLETAGNLLKLGLPYAQIAAATGLTEQDLRKKLSDT